MASPPADAPPRGRGADRGGDRAPHPPTRHYHLAVGTPADMMVSECVCEREREGELLRRRRKKHRPVSILFFFPPSLPSTQPAVVDLVTALATDGPPGILVLCASRATLDAAASALGATPPPSAPGGASPPPPEAAAAADLTLLHADMAPGDRSAALAAFSAALARRRARSPPAGGDDDAPPSPPPPPRTAAALVATDAALGAGGGGVPAAAGLVVCLDPPRSKVRGKEKKVIKKRNARPFSQHHTLHPSTGRLHQAPGPAGEAPPAAAGGGAWGVCRRAAADAG